MILGGNMEEKCSICGGTPVFPNGLCIECFSKELENVFLKKELGGKRKILFIFVSLEAEAKITKEKKLIENSKWN